MRSLIYEHDEFHKNHDMAFDKVNRMIEGLDGNCERSVQIVYNYVGNFIKIFKSPDNSNIQSLHRSLFKDLQRIQNGKV